MLSLNAETGYSDEPLGSARPMLDVTLTLQLPTFSQVWQRLMNSRSSSIGVDHTAREHEHELVTVLKLARAAAERRERDGTADALASWRQRSRAADGEIEPPPDFYAGGEQLGTGTRVASLRAAEGSWPRRQQA